MSGLRKALDEYLALRRSLGFSLRVAGYLLDRFVSFAEQNKAPYITKSLALEWATQPVHAQPAEWTRRLSIVRGFSQYCSALDSRTEVPPAGLLPYRYRRKSPYLYTDHQITALIKVAEKLPSKTGLRSRSYSTLLGLLAVTGMRISEVVGLDCTDVDWVEAVLTTLRANVT